MVILNPKEPTPKPLRLIIWYLGLGFIAAYGIFLYLLDDLGFLDEDWGWILVVGVTLFFIADFFFIRFILNGRLRKKFSSQDE